MTRPRLGRLGRMAGAVLLLTAAWSAGATRPAPVSSAPKPATAVRTLVALPASSAVSPPRPTTRWTPGWTPRWRIGANAAGGIRGFADRAGVTPGEPVRLFVSTRSASFVVRAYRMGWHRGVAGSLVWSSAQTPGRRQGGAALVGSATRTYAAPWRASLTVPTANWPPGAYLFRLDASDGGQSFVPLTVSARSAVGAVVLVSPVTTWQAYNLWGCCDLYEGGDGNFADRSTAVSFDRPYLMQDGAGQFIRDELGVVAEAERLGLRLDFVTDVDLDARPGLVRGASAIVSMGHDEYWSPRMRDTLASAEAHGTNLAFFGANAIFRRIRFDATSTGPDRLEINYKIASEDPLFGRDNRSVTADWAANPDPRPESSLLGDQYGCLLTGPAQPGVITRPGSWLYRGITVHAGERLPHLIGPEVDAIQRQYRTPAGIVSVMHSPVQCPNDTPSHADASYYVSPSGAAVFDAGTINWACEVAPVCPGASSALTHAVVGQVTDNILHAFSHGPVRRRRNR